MSRTQRQSRGERSRGAKPESDARLGTPPRDSAGFLFCLVQNPQRTLTSGSSWPLPPHLEPVSSPDARICGPGRVPLRRRPGSAPRSPARPPASASRQAPGRHPSAVLTSVCDCWWPSASLAAPCPPRSGAHTRSVRGSLPTHAEGTQASLHCSESRKTAGDLTGEHCLRSIVTETSCDLIR